MFKLKKDGSFINFDGEEKPIQFLSSYLLKEVSFYEKITFRDIMYIIKNIGCKELLGEMAWCNFDAFYEELDKPIDSKRLEESLFSYIELKWSAEIYNEVLEECIDVHGIDNNSKDKLTYAIEFMPVNLLAHMEVKLNNKYDIYDANKKTSYDTIMSTNKDMKLIDILVAVLYEISFCGNPESRDDQWEGLKISTEEINKAIKNGNIDEITKPMFNDSDEND